MISSASLTLLEGWIVYVSHWWDANLICLQFLHIVPIPFPFAIWDLCINLWQINIPSDYGPWRCQWHAFIGNIKGKSSSPSKSPLDNSGPMALFGGVTVYCIEECLRNKKCSIHFSGIWMLPSLSFKVILPWIAWSFFNIHRPTCLF